MGLSQMGHEAHTSTPQASANRLIGQRRLPKQREGRAWPAPGTRDSLRPSPENPANLYIVAIQWTLTIFTVFSAIPSNYSDGSNYYREVRSVTTKNH